MNQAHRNQDLP
uniref:Uncharacterized protein n=1 Tax=Rhizophora mucronata TaxID=61149 RepID=A0A2P2NHF5_RHIMU